ncbi:hypothetical protein LZK98_17455 [Sphingomonas cannabina]|uniref:sigma factor-like helix-turn-helix DNA-binding protein n=1 Tax=Sphingomonas cannabina TaxID=2899123 RepID=UPI001F29C43F|nr:sigma factor-like helix-turn-helix DNA-binding protein [Sphingomonas cannabina]UIJ47458.1 hypothetical protein LZK98_17455 [Sphingomonas cannabina]
MDRSDDERRAALRAALDRLPLWPREVYCLSAVEGLGHAAIAARLGIDMGEVERRLAEAIVLIGAQLAASDGRA